MIPFLAKLVCIGIAFVPATVSHATPTSSEACEYFFAHVGIAGPAVDTDHRLVNQPEFVSIKIEIDRYESLLITNSVWEFGETQGTDFNRLGKISANALCNVDIIDRRVLEIWLFDGPDVGTETTTFRGDRREVRGPTLNYIAVGDLHHQGKF
jgi:hypothetical protein